MAEKPQVTHEQRIVYYLGGTKTSGLQRGDVRTPLSAHAAIKRGLPLASAKWARDHLGLERKTFDVVIPRQTLESASARKHKRLTAAQSERLLRLARIYALAEEAFGDRARAARWMDEVNDSFEGHRPAELLETELGADSVEQMLGRLMHGIAAHREA